jgi:uncharacterized protein (TIGR00730 family)
LLTEYASAAQQCGQLLAQRGVTLVYGGGNVGLMGIVADAALAAGGEVIGVIPRHLIQRELAHHGLTTLIPVDTMHERKFKMAELADGFLALPGGIGTLEELFEAFTWLQLDLHTKPVGLLNTAGYYQMLLEFLTYMQDQRFLKPVHLQTLLVDSDLPALLQKMAAFTPRPVAKWMGDGPATTTE